MEAAVAISPTAATTLPSHRGEQFRIHVPRPDAWLIRFFSGRTILVVRIRDGVDQAVERLFQDRQRDPCALGLLVDGDGLDTEALHVVEHTLAGAIEISETLVAVAAQEIQDHQFVLALRDVDRVLRRPVFDSRKMLHRMVSRERRIEIRARRAASRSIAEDSIACSAIDRAARMRGAS